MVTRVLLFGTGGVGICYAWILTKAGAQVVTVCRSNYDAAKRHGFTIKSVKWNQELSFRPHDVVQELSATADHEWDYIVVCTKAGPNTASLIKPAVSAHTTIVLIQNGVGIEEAYKELYPENTLVSGSVNILVTQTRPGHAELLGSQTRPGQAEMGGFVELTMGLYPPSAAPVDTQKRDAFLQLCLAGGSNASTSDNIASARWRKLMSNAAFNPLTALTRISVPILVTEDPGKRLCRKVMLEVVALANADGCDDVTPQVADAILSRVAEYNDTPDGRVAETSMLSDIRIGRPVEDWAILGNALTVAKKRGIACPTIETLYELTRCLNKAIEIGSLNQTTREALRLG